MHVEDGQNLVRYFEQLVREEVSLCNSAHDWAGPSQANLPRGPLLVGDDDVHCRRRSL